MTWASSRQSHVKGWPLEISKVYTRFELMTDVSPLSCDSGEEEALRIAGQAATCSTHEI